MPPKVDHEMRQDIADMKASITFLCKSVEEIQKSNKVNDGKIADLLKAMHTSHRSFILTIRKGCLLSSGNIKTIFQHAGNIFRHQLKFSL